MSATLLFVLLISDRACPQEQPTNPYTAFHGMDTFEGEGEELKSLRLAVYITLRSWSKHTWGLRLRLAGTVATGDLTASVQDELTQVRIMGIVPGVEFVIPITRHHMLRPFLDLGGGVNDVTSGLDILADMGLRAEFIFPHGKNIYGLEPGIRYSYNSGDTRSDKTQWNSFLTVTARRELGSDVGGYPPDIGVYVEGGYDFQTLELASVSTSSGDVTKRFELGVGFGFSRGRPKLWFFRIPRLRVGYRFGDVTGFRIRLGGDWLTTVATRGEIEASLDGGVR